MDNYLAKLRTGASIFIIRDEKISTPMVTDGILESLTRKLIIGEIAVKLKLTVNERQIDRSELYLADEIFTAGTLSEISPVTNVDGHTISIGINTKNIIEEYEKIFNNPQSSHCQFVPI